MDDFIYKLQDLLIRYEKATSDNVEEMSRNMMRAMNQNSPKIKFAEPPVTREEVLEIIPQYFMITQDEYGVVMRKFYTPKEAVTGREVWAEFVKELISNGVRNPKLISIQRC